METLKDGLTVDVWWGTSDPNAAYHGLMASQDLSKAIVKGPASIEALLEGHGTIALAAVVRVIGEDVPILYDRKVVNGDMFAQFARVVADCLAPECAALVRTEAALAAGSLFGQFARVPQENTASGLSDFLPETVNVGETCRFVSDMMTATFTQIADYDVAAGYATPSKSSLYRTREAAISAAGEIGDLEAVPALIEMVAHGTSGDGGAILSLGKLRAVESIPVMADLIATPQSGLRMLVAIALGDMGSQVGLETLYVLAKDPKSRVRRQVCESIAMIGDRTARPALLDLREDPDDEVRRAARKALWKVSRVAKG